MNKTMRILAGACVLLTMALFVGCSDDDTTPTEPGGSTSMAGSIGIYADAGGTNPNINDTGAVVTVYVVHNVPNGATAAQFRVEAPAGWTVQSESAQFPVAIGDVSDGIALGYGTCRTDAVHLMTLTYQSPGTSTGSFRVLPHTQTPDAIQVVDCSDNLLTDADGESTPVN